MSRRLRGTGGIFYLKKRKRWVWVGTYKNNLGEKKKKWLSATTQKELKKLMDDFTAQLTNNILYSDMSIEYWIKQWLEIVEKPMVHENTYLWYINILKYIHFTCNIEKDGEQYIQKEFSKEKISLVTPIKIQELLRNLKYFGNKNNKALSPRTVNSFRRVLGMAFKAAMENGFIKNNPVLKTKPFKVPKDQIVVLNEQEIQRFLAVIKDGKYLNITYKNKKRNMENEYYKKECYTLVYLAFASGMRISEICSLKWTDINFNESYLEVKWVLKTDNSKRKINLDTKTVDVLKQFKNHQSDFQKTYDKFNNKYNYVFTTGIGKKLQPDNFRECYWRKMVREAGIPDNFRIHCMRHTHATLLLKNGVNVKVVSKRLGHATVEFTLKTYAHVIEEMEENAANTWGEIMKEK